MIFNRTLTTVGIMIMMLTPSIKAKDVDLSGKTIADWTFPKALMGDEPNEENLKNKVVVLEYWGVR